jgi:NAD(P)-dependent dehydrogenase (short-subunit alcohol dehydrogenase family)
MHVIRAFLRARNPFDFPPRVCGTVVTLWVGCLVASALAFGRVKAESDGDKFGGTDSELFDQIYALNVRAPFLLMQGVASMMR